MNIEILKNSINNKFDEIENKIDILASEPDIIDDKEQIHSYTVNQLFEEINRLNKEMPYAYVAGFFDGEGCISINRNNLQTTLSNTDFEILVKLKNEFGGNIYKEKKKENYKQKWIWQISDRSTLKYFLNRIYKYTTVKRQQIEYGLKFLELSTKSTPKGGLSEDELKIRKFFNDKLKELKYTKLSNDELKMFEDEIINIDKDKNQPTFDDY